NDAAEAAPALLKIAKGQDQAAKSATAALANITKAPRSAAPALAIYLKDPEPAIRIKAIEYLCDLEENDAECLTELLELVKRRDSTVREKSARLIARYGSAAKPAVPALVEILRTDHSASTKSAAVEALGNIGPDAKAALPALAGLEKQLQ